MECAKCREPVEPGEEKEFHDRTLCEDGYLDSLSPARTCDPWAIPSAKTLQSVLN